MISKFFLLIALLCLGLYGFFVVQAHFRQAELEEELYQPLPIRVNATPVPRNLKEGDLFGRLEVPRLNLSVMVMEGDADDILRLGAGHVPGTPMAIAGHRDSFFRPLKDIKVADTIRFTTPDGSSDYHVVSTKIVGPNDTFVLDAKDDNTMTLITCYPFYYVGPAPKRFIVEAAKN
jgi:sortase A